MIPKELTDLRQWVTVRKDEKIPRNVQGFSASSSNPETWDSYDNCLQALQQGKCSNIGFVFNGNGIVGIDIDKGFEDLLMTPLCADIMGACGSYTEVSRSGRGVHIFVRGDLPFTGRNNRNGVEIYKSGRFFIMTGDVLLFPEIRENQEAIDYVVSRYFPEVRTGSERTKSYPKLYTPEWRPPKPGQVPVSPDYTEIKPGSRNDCLTSLAGSLWNQGYTRQQIRKELLKVNKAACRPPLPQGEVDSIVKSITRYRR